jgi:hypothetical protein
MWRAHVPLTLALAATILLNAATPLINALASGALVSSLEGVVPT